MRILHYFLGFPPYRSGGLTKYATDMMKSQVQRNDEVYALWPGKIDYLSVIKKNTKINTRIKIHVKVDEIISCELINPLPIPLDEGIKDIEAYTRKCDKGVYQKFFNDIRPDVIHIHTLMGLHKEFIEVANEEGIKTIFTSHDYFGLCPKVTLYRDGKVCDGNPDCKNCVTCNKNALSLKKIVLLQSPLYRNLKESALVKKLRQKHRQQFFEKVQTDNEVLDIDKNEENNSELKQDFLEQASQYEMLRKYYVDMYEHIDVIHFNSTVAKSVYERFLTPKYGRVISISHKNIGDNTSENAWNYDEKLKITYLATPRAFKGFNTLLKALDELWENGNKNFILRIYKTVDKVADYIKLYPEGFAYEELGEVMAQTDVLVAPSIWYETFGYTVLEAISYGVPVIVSKNVGAKDIIGDGGIIVEPGNVSELKTAILSMSKDKQRSLRNNIKKMHIKTWDEFLDEMYMLYKEGMDNSMGCTKQNKQKNNIENLRRDAVRIIKNVFNAKENEILNFEIMKEGMTNSSFTFEYKNKRYIIRMPGKGTDKLINRKHEANVYEVIAPFDISDKIVYFDKATGYKITEYVADARNCNIDSEDDLSKCIGFLRDFHNKKLQVAYEFNVYCEIEKYESLWKGKASVYDDYLQVKEKVLSLKDFIDNNIEKWTLCHIDANYDNFLITENSIRLIDWEYAGMQDPDIDIAMFGIYAMYDRKQIDRIIDIYCEGKCDIKRRIKIYCYCATCGLLWSNWCEYKRNLGIDFGEYAIRQYEYAKEYYDIAKSEMEKHVKGESLYELC